MTDAIDDIERELEADVERQVRAMRGQWLVVDETGVAVRYSRKSQARSHVDRSISAGIAAHLVRYRRDRVYYAGGCLVATAARWKPTLRYYPGGPLCIADDATECECGSAGDDGRDSDDEHDPNRREPDQEDRCTCSRGDNARRLHVGPCDWCGKELGP
jgi:hypothetical protein